jgi:feruloyl esterase
MRERQIGSRALTMRAIAAAAGLLLTTMAAPAVVQARSAEDCAQLAHAAVPGASVTSAELVRAGRLSLGAAPAYAPDLQQRVAGLPTFCRVHIVAVPTTDSRIGIEVWLPLDRWNGRLLGTGNGGGAGSIAYAMGMVEGLKRGFAVANTDMGTAPDINSLRDHPERWIDFGHRGTHEMTRIAKLLVRGFYDVTSFRAYFAGCSTGGQQALSAAQRYPADYDGILAGDPGNNRTHVASYFLWNYQALNAAPGSKLSSAQWGTVNRAVLAACVGKDGGAPGDRFLTDPRLCRFDPASLPLCKAGDDTGSCLTQLQLAAVSRLYAGPTHPDSGERIYAGLTHGSETLPLGPLQQGDANIFPPQQFYLFGWALGGGFDPMAFGFGRDLDAVDARLSSTLNANDADLSDFARRGGKLLLYTGLADPAVPFAEVANYYDRVTGVSGDATRGFARLFAVPGMGHCFGGPGATNIGQPFTSGVPADVEGDALMTLVAWTEGGPAPERLIARKPAGAGLSVQERPICAYPAFPDYRGGDPSKRTSFSCTEHSRGTDQPAASRYLN